jgi:hypothetical protein
MGYSAYRSYIVNKARVAYTHASRRLFKSIA